MSGSVDTRMSRPEAIEIAKAFVADIEPYTDRLIVAGSLRRRLALIGDIEIVAVTHVERLPIGMPDLFGEHAEGDVDLLDARLDQMLRSGDVSKRLDANGAPRWGPTLTYLTYRGARVDLFTPSWDRFGWIALLRTGPAAFSRQLVVEKGRRTKDGRPGLLPAHIKPRDGYLTYRTSGERIETPDEETVFALFTLAYIPPQERQ